MADLQGLIRDDHILTLSYDKDRIQQVLDRVLSLFRAQSERINNIEAQLPNFASKDYVSSLSEEVGEIEQHVDTKLAVISSKFETLEKTVEEKIKEVSDNDERAHLEMMTDTKRYLDDQIESFAPAFHPDKNPLEDAFEALKKDFDNLREEFRNVPVVEQDDRTTNLENTVESLKNRLKEVTFQLKDYNNIENDVSNLVLQFPAVTKRVERKVNEVIDYVDTLKLQAPQLSVQSPAISPIYTPKVLSKNNSATTSKKAAPMQEETSEAPALPPLVSQRSSSRENDVVEDIKKGAENGNEQKEEEEEKEKKAEEEVKEDEEEEVNLKMEPVPTKEQLLEEVKVLKPLDLPIAQEEDNDEDEPFQIRLKNGGKVEIHETHTYKTELRSSVHIISEIEWLKSTIKQHHEAIRQVQQNIRTQLDAFDTQFSNLIKANQSQSGRIAQVAQQINSAFEAIDDSKKQTDDKLKQIQKKMLLISMKEPAPVVETKAPSAREPEKVEEEAPKSAKPKNHNRKKMITLPALPAIIKKEEEKVEEEVKPAPVEKPKEKEELEEYKPPPKKNFTFTFSHFSTGEDSKVVLSKIDARKAEPIGMNVFSHIDLFTSIEPTPKKEVVEQKPTPKPTPERRVVPQKEELESPPITPEKTPEKRTTIIVNERRPTKDGRLRRPQTTENFNAVPMEIQQELIEEKVGKEARKVVADLSVALRENVKEQLNEMLKEVNKAVNLIDNKIDRTFVETMFNKFRIMMKEINTKIDNLNCSFLDWVTRDELEMVLQRFMNIIQNKADSCGTTSKFTCLLCGRPRAHLAGMLDEHQAIPRASSSKKPGSAVKTSHASRSLNVSSSGTRKSSLTKPNSPESRHPKDVIQLLTSV